METRENKWPIDANQILHEAAGATKARKTAYHQFTIAFAFVSEWSEVFNLKTVLFYAC